MILKISAVKALLLAGTAAFIIPFSLTSSTSIHTVHSTYAAVKLTPASAVVHYGNITRHGRLDEHTGMAVSRNSHGKDIAAYKDSGCEVFAKHYMTTQPQDWYNNLNKKTGSSISIEYPDTVELDPNDEVYKEGGGKPTTIKLYWFKLKEFEANTDSESGYFSYDWNLSKWYNKLPCQITYVDEHQGGNDAETYVSNNVGFKVTKENVIWRTKMLQLNGGKGTVIMDQNGISAHLHYHPDETRYKYLADLYWTRASKAWSTVGLKEGKNNVYFAGTDASANYTLGKNAFLYDITAPTINITPESQTTDSGDPISVTIRVKDNPSDDSDGTCSGLKYYQLRVSAGDGTTMGSWSSNYTGTEVIKFAKPGKYRVDVRAWDNAGNSSVKTAGYYTVGGSGGSSTGGTVSGDYRTDTDVITPVNVSSGREVNPESPGTVTFSIPGITTQSKSFVLPAGGSEPVWFKWHTPSTEQSLTATVTISSPGSSQTLNPVFKVSDLTEKTPPDPKSGIVDNQDAYFQYTTAPNLATKTSSSWNVYSAQHERWLTEVYNEKTKKYEAKYYYIWAFTNNTYHATLSATLQVKPDAYCPTATENYGVWTIASGYGIQENVSTSISTNDSSAVIGAQNIVGYYPEFMYGDPGYSFGGYDRVFETLSSGLNAAFNLKMNKYSEYQQHVHFLPEWWKDYAPYQPTVLVMDAYTPGGELRAQSTDTVNIKGTVHGDWYIKPGI